MTPKYLNTFGKRVRILRTGVGWTQQQLVDRLIEAGAPIGRSYVSEWERTSKTPTGDIVAALAQVLNTTTDYLLMLTDEDEPQTDVIEAFSEEAEEVAQLIDEMTPERRQDAVAIVRALYQQDKANGRQLHRYDILLNRIRERDGENGVQQAEELLGRFLDSLSSGRSGTGTG